MNTMKIISWSYFVISLVIFIWLGFFLRDVINIQQNQQIELERVWRTHAMITKSMRNFYNIDKRCHRKLMRTVTKTLKDKKS